MSIARRGVLAGLGVLALRPALADVSFIGSGRRFELVYLPSNGGIGGGALPDYANIYNIYGAGNDQWPTGRAFTAIYQLQVAKINQLINGTVPSVPGNPASLPLTLQTSLRRLINAGVGFEFNTGTATLAFQKGGGSYTGGANPANLASDVAILQTLMQSGVPVRRINMQSPFGKLTADPTLPFEGVAQRALDVAWYVNAIKAALGSMAAGIQFGNDSSVCAKGLAWLIKWFGPTATGGTGELLANATAVDFDALAIATMAAQTPAVHLDAWDQDVQWSSLQDFVPNGASNIAALKAEQAFLASQGISPGMLLYDSSSSTDAIFNSRVLAMLRAAMLAPSVAGRRFEVLSARPVPVCELPDTGATACVAASAFPMSRVLKNVGAALNNTIYVNQLLDLSATCTAVKSGAAAGTVVGTISNGDPASTYTLLNNGGGPFALANGNQIVTTATVTITTPLPTYQLVVQEARAGIINSPKQSTIPIQVVGLTPVASVAPWMDLCPDVTSTLTPSSPTPGTVITAIAGFNTPRGTNNVIGAGATFQLDSFGNYLQFTNASGGTGYRLPVPNVQSGYTIFVVAQVPTASLANTGVLVDVGSAETASTVNRISLLFAGSNGYLHRRGDNINVPPATPPAQNNTLAAAQQGQNTGDSGYHVFIASAGANPTQAFGQVDQVFFDDTSFAGRFSVGQTYPITSISWSAGIVTVTGSVVLTNTIANGGLGVPVGGTTQMTISGATPAGYNTPTAPAPGGGVTATVTSNTTFTYPLAANPGTATTLGVFAQGNNAIFDSMTLGLRTCTPPIKSNFTGNIRRVIVYLSNLSSADQSAVVNQLTALYQVATSFNDGSVNAPVGPAQYPTLLNGYVARPPWKVAGVDYRVGFPAGQTFINIRTSQPANTTLSGNLLTVNADNVTIDGYDFTQGNGVAVSCGAQNLTIQNCQFGGSNLTSVGTGIIDFRGHNLTMKYNVIDGGDTTGAAGAQCVFFVFPQTSSVSNDSGNVVFQYNWFKNYGSQIVEFLNSAALDYRFNLIDDTFVPSGAHQNYLQWGAGTATSPVFAFNTTKQASGHRGAEGPQWYFNNPPGTMVSPTCSNNVFLAPGSSGGSTMSNIVHGSANTAGTTLTGIALAQNNYFDPSGTFFNASNGAGAFYVGPPTSMTGWTVGGNINMIDGTNIPFSIVVTGIGLSATSVNFPTGADANSFVATITVTATGGTYAGTLSLGGTDGGKFALSNGGVYPCNLIVGPANIAASPPGGYQITITAP